MENYTDYNLTVLVEMLSRRTKAYTEMLADTYATADDIRHLKEEVDMLQILITAKQTHTELIISE